MEHFLIWETQVGQPGYPGACGMMSPTHLIVTVICLALLGLALWYSRGISEKAYRRIVLICAVTVTVLECCKIAFNWAHGGFTPNRWLPLTFCSFSIYAYWMIACGNDFIRSLGVSFMAGGGIIGGLTFLVMPMTSVATYPMLHFQSCYSMLFHSIMMYVGISCVTRGYFKFERGGFRKYLTAAVPALALAMVVSLVYYAFTKDMVTCNMMFLVYPYRLEDMFPFIGTIYHTVWGGGLLYAVSACTVYLTLPYFIPCGVVRLIKKCGACKAKERVEETV